MDKADVGYKKETLMLGMVYIDHHPQIIITLIVY